MSTTNRVSPFLGKAHDGHHYIGHTHFWERALMSRRQFMTAAAGATGVVLGSGLWIPGLALADDNAPRPIPGGIQPFGPGTEVFHVFLPGHGAEPSTITDFHGSIGVAHLQGTGTGTDTGTGATSSLVFDVDMRFMQGVYIGLDGEKHNGTFHLIWLDLYKGQVVPANQIHDFNPGIAPSGLFWTIRVPDESVKVDLEKATASMDINNVEIRDFGTLVNSLMHGPSVPADVSFHVRWSGVANRFHLHDATNMFDAQVIEDSATIRWSARRPDFKFVSDPANTSTTVFAEIGHERNGVFFPDNNLWSHIFYEKRQVVANGLAAFHEPGWM